MAEFFKVSDKDEQNFPKNQAELENRLAIIRQGLPQQGDNIVSFVVPAFTLFKDCGLIIEENIKFLNDTQFWYNVFKKIKINPLGGVLRKYGLTMWDKNNLRYYCPKEELVIPSDIEMARKKAWNGKSKLAVVFNNETYYISNDWFAEGKSTESKVLFYDWLVKKAETACQKRWSQSNVIQSANSSRAVEPSLDKKTIEVPISQIEQLEKTINNLCYIITNLDNRIGALENKINNMEQKIEKKLKSS